jgi:hypothetical protein
MSLVIGFLLLFILMISALAESMTPFLPPPLFASKEYWEERMEKDRRLSKQVQLGMQPLVLSTGRSSTGALTINRR